MAASMTTQASGAQVASSVDANQLQQSLTNLFNVYCQFEANQKLRAETEQKFNIMVDRMAAGSLHDLTLQKLKAISDAVEASNHQAASTAFRELTVKCWNDVKDFSNAMKALSSFKAKYGQ